MNKTVVYHNAFSFQKSRLRKILLWLNFLLIHSIYPTSPHPHCLKSIWSKHTWAKLNKYIGTYSVNKMTSNYRWAGSIKWNTQTCNSQTEWSLNIHPNYEHSYILTNSIYNLYMLFHLIRRVHEQPTFTKHTVYNILHTLIL